MRVTLEQLTSEQLASMSRTTRWRAQKRGWVCVAKPRPRKREPREAVSLAAFNSVPLGILMSEANAIARKQYMPAFPRWLSREDLVQECLLHLLRRSALAGFRDAAWRKVVMSNRLRDLTRKRRELELTEIGEHKL